MFFGPIKEAVALNKLDLAAVEGKKVYYSKIANWISLVWNVLVIGVLIYVPFAYLHSDKERYLILLLLLVIGLQFHTLIEIIARLIIKQPVLIMHDGQLYYLKTNTWYDVTKYTFKDESMGRYNYLETYCMYHRSGERIFAEKNWHLKNEDALKDFIRYVKLVHFKERGQKQT